MNLVNCYLVKKNFFKKKFLLGLTTDPLPSQRQEPPAITSTQPIRGLGLPPCNPTWGRDTKPKWASPLGFNLCLVLFVCNKHVVSHRNVVHDHKPMASTSERCSWCVPGWFQGPDWLVFWDQNRFGRLCTSISGLATPPHHGLQMMPLTGGGGG